MDSNVVKLDVKFDSDWKATGAWVSGGPIFLVELESGTGDVRKSRFDLQKACFIDPAPGASQKGILKLTESLAAISQAKAAKRNDI